MAVRSFALIGGGNIRCCPEVVACLSQLNTTDEVVVTLFDSNNERLDLMDRLARVILDRQKEQFTIRANSDLKDALEEATDVVLMFNEDCARRMTSSQTEVATDIANDEEILFSKGDANKPTPISELSFNTRQILSRPNLSHLTREEVISRAVSDFEREWSGNGSVISLIRDVPTSYRSFAWPAPLTETEIWQRPHQILRWIALDDSIYELIQAAEKSEFLRAIQSDLS